MKVAWLLGWAVPAEWFAARARSVWPEAEHACVAAAPDWRERLEALGEVDAVGAYSLGALLALREREWLARRGVRVGLIAPIWAFAAEAGRGGRVERARVRALDAWVGRDAGGAAADFYRRAGLREVRGGIEAAEVLRWGLERLARDEAEPGLPAGWWAGVGAGDAILDAEALRKAEPAVRVIAGAGHGPETLIHEWMAMVVS